MTLSSGYVSTNHSQDYSLTNHSQDYSLTNHSQDYSLSFSPRFSKFECNTTVTINFSFSHSVWRTFFHFHQIWNCRLQPHSIWKSPKFLIWERVKNAERNLRYKQLKAISIQSTIYNVMLLTFSQKSPGFYMSAVQVFWKRCGKRRIAHIEEFLKFSFSHNVFYPFGELSAILIKFENFVCKHFQFGRV